MKWLLVLLVLVNLAIHAYFNWLPGPATSQLPGHEPIHPELLRILPPPTNKQAVAE